MYVSLAPELNDVSGKYFRDCNEASYWVGVHVPGRTVQILSVLHPSLAPRLPYLTPDRWTPLQHPCMKRDPDLGEKLWAKSVELSGTDFPSPIPKKPEKAQVNKKPEKVT